MSYHSKKLSLRNYTLDNSYFSNCEINSFDCPKYGTISSSSYSDCILSEITGFKKCVLLNCKIRCCGVILFENSKLVNCEIYGARFEGCNLMKCHIQKCSYDKIEIDDCKVET